MKWLKRIGLQLGVTVVALALLFTVGAPVLQNLAGQSQVAQKALVTIGFAGEAYAVTPDYQVDGVADDVQVQQAINALPTTGGRLVLFAGNYVFSATVSRAINNITIEGDGKGTYLAYNAAAPLFTAGAQTGWIFKDFRTDAGWITLAADTRLLGALWKGTELISNVVASGTTMPASPVIGQQFFQTTTGRNVLYSYNGSSWYAMQAFGDTTVYVDSAGTNDLNHGTATGVSAFQTIQYAYNYVANIKHLSGNVDINLAAQTFTENVTITNIPSVPMGSRFYINGAAMTVVASLVATGGAAGSGNATARVSGAFVAGVHDNKLIQFTSGTNNDGSLWVVGKTTTTNLYLNGPKLAAAPGGVDTYNILDWATTITGNIDVRGGRGQYNNIGNIPTFVRIKFNGVAGSNGVIYANATSVGIAFSKIISNASGGDIFADVGAYVCFYRGIMTANVTSGEYAAYAQWLSQIDILGSRIIGKGDASGIGVFADTGSGISFDASEVYGFFDGVLAWRNAFVNTGLALGAGSTVTGFIHGNSNYGSAAEKHSVVTDTATSAITYGVRLDLTADPNGIANTAADAATFSAIVP